MGSKLLGFSDYEQKAAKKQTYQEKFLVEIEDVLSWKDVISLIEPHYLKSS